MCINSPVGINNEKLIIDRIIILIMHLSGNKSKLKLPFILNINFDNSSNTRHKYPGSFEMKSVIIAKELDFIVVLVEFIISFQVLFVFSILDIILKLYPSTVVVAFDEVGDLFR